MTTETHPTDGALARLARFCYRRRRLVLLAWIVGVLAVAFVGFRFGAASDNDFSGGDTDSARAQALIERHFPEQQGDTLTLAIKAGTGIDDPAARAKIEKVIARSGRLPDDRTGGLAVPGRESGDEGSPDRPYDHPADREGREEEPRSSPWSTRSRAPPVTA